MGQLFFQSRKFLLGRAKFLTMNLFTVTVDTLIKNDFRIVNISLLCVITLPSDIFQCSRLYNSNLLRTPKPNLTLLTFTSTQLRIAPFPRLIQFFITLVILCFIMNDLLRWLSLELPIENSFTWLFALL